VIFDLNTLLNSRKAIGLDIAISTIGVQRRKEKGILHGIFANGVHRLIQEVP